jgi:prepilin-type N-terminal cleavage/methylation domain-containing protein
MPMATYAFKRGSRGGFSLVEAMIVVVILGVLVLLVAPRFDPIIASRNVSNARSGFMNLYSRARIAAVQARRKATITVTGNLATATVDMPLGPQAVGTAIRFDSLYGVQAEASPTSVTIQPTGLVIGGLPFELVLVRSSVADTVRITAYGKIQ